MNVNQLSVCLEMTLSSRCECYRVHVFAFVSVCLCLRPPPTYVGGFFMWCLFVCVSLLQIWVIFKMDFFFTHPFSTLYQKMFEVSGSKSAQLIRTIVGVFASLELILDKIFYFKCIQQEAPTRGFWVCQKYQHHAVNVVGIIKCQFHCYLYMSHLSLRFMPAQL